MNPNVLASIRAVIEQVLGEKNLASKADVRQLVAAAVSAELGLAAGEAPAPATHGKEQGRQPPRASDGRKTPQTTEQRRAKRAAYQRKYRAQQKGTGGTDAAAPTPAGEQKPPTKAASVKNGAPLPPTIAQVPSVDLGDL